MGGGIYLGWEMAMSELKLTDREWGEFFVKQLFQTFKGTKGIQTHTGSFVSKDNLKLSTMPRITVRDTNNGIDSFCVSNDKNFRIFENIISVSFLGSAFYHPYQVSLDMKVHALIPINFSLNKYTAKFLIPSIKSCINSLSYGNQLSSTDLPKVRILLPIDNLGNPDWQFMEDYIKQIENKKVKEIVAYYQEKILTEHLTSSMGGG